jgi:prephenate dehydratase
MVGYPYESHLLRAVKHREVDYGVVPQASCGYVSELAYRLDREGLEIVGEIRRQEPRFLCGTSDASVPRLNCIVSDATTLSECEGFICSVEEKNGVIVNRQTMWDNAAACETVKQERAGNVGVIASHEAAIRYGLNILEQVFPDTHDNLSPYVVVGCEAKGALLGPSSLNVRWATVFLHVQDGVEGIERVVCAFKSVGLVIDEFCYKTLTLRHVVKNVEVEHVMDFVHFSCKSQYVRAC